MYFLPPVFLMRKTWSIYLKFVAVAVFLCVLNIACFVIITGNEAYAKSVYEEQPPFTNDELVSFIELLPQFRGWARAFEVKAHPIVNEKGKADFVYSQQAAEWVLSKNWKPERFFAIMGRAAAALAIIEDGNDLLTRRPTDMPTVSEEELSLVRRNLSSLLKAGSAPTPIE